jgi:prefoldin subunit 1
VSLHEFLFTLSNIPPVWTFSTTTRPETSLIIGRFVLSPITGVDTRLKAETQELKSDVENLGKKLQYLETTYKNSREHIDQIFSSGGRG